MGEVKRISRANELKMLVDESKEHGKQWEKYSMGQEQKLKAKLPSVGVCNRRHKTGKHIY